jgi:hypothetical protein
MNRRLSRRDFMKAMSLLAAAGMLDACSPYAHTPLPKFVTARPSPTTGQTPAISPTLTQEPFVAAKPSPTTGQTPAISPTLTREPMVLTQLWTNDVLVALLYVLRDMSDDPTFSASILDQFQPDVIDGSGTSLSPRDLMWRGIKLSGWNQETYNECHNNNECAQFSDAWDVDLNGNTTTSYWSPGVHTTDVLVPSWSSHVLQGLLEEVGRADAIHQDNVGGPSFESAGAGFDDYAKQEFQGWLQQRFSTQELASMSIPNIQMFDIASYIRNKKLYGSPQAIEDPVFREFVLFNHVANLQKWKQMVDAVKADAAKIGVDVPISGNQFTRTGENVYGVLVSQYMDTISDEVCYGGLAGRWMNVPTTIGLPPKFRLTSTYKIDLAAAGETKPLWLMGVPSTDQGNTLFLQPNFWKLIVSEAYASSAVRKIEVTQISRIRKQLLPKKTLDELARYANWFKANPGVFSKHRSFVNVGLVYSVPTLLWRHFPATGLTPSLQIDAFHGWARLLEEEHLPYDVIIFGHPELWDDKAALASLNQYQTLILPQVDALSDRQEQALISYVKNGGNLIITGNGIMHDENSIRVENGALNILNACQGTACGAGKILKIAGELDASLFRNIVTGQVAPERAGLETILRRAIQTPLVATDADQAITINLYHNGNHGLLVHLLNYDIDVKTDVLNETKPIAIEISLPNSSGSLGLKASLLNPDSSGPLDLMVAIDKGNVKIQVPPFNVYTVIEIYDPTEKDAAKALSQAGLILSMWDSKGLSFAEVQQTFQQATNNYEAGQYGLTVKNSLLARIEASRDVFNYLRLSKRPRLSVSSQLDQADQDLGSGNLLAATEIVNEIESSLTDALKPRILFDESHGQGGTIDMNRALQLEPNHPEYVLHSFGPEASADRFVASGLTSDALADYDILAVYCPAMPFSQSELDAVRMFVNNGGGLLLIGNATSPCDFGGLEDNYGFKFIPQVVGAPDNPQDAHTFVITDIDRVDLTRGVVEIGVNWGGSLQLISGAWRSVARTSSDSWIDANSDGVKDPNETTGPFTYMAYREIGQGRILAIADNAPFQQWAQPPILSDNIIAWLARMTPKPSEGNAK